jgi:lysophospholipase L1-like esterase
MKKRRSWLRRVSAVALGIAAFPVLLEATLWALHFGVRETARADLERLAPRAGERRILCVGDSNTFGIHLEACASYPGRLQRYLDLDPDNPWRVVNLGWPGQNTAQIRARLAENLAAYKPEIVIVWAGVNNTWSPAMRHLWDVPDRETEASTGETVVQQIRVFKLARMLTQRLRGTPQAPKPAKPGQGAIPGLDGAARGEGLGVVETAFVEQGVRFSDDEVARSIGIDLRRIRDICGEHGARLVIADYPWVTPSLERCVNPALDEAAAELALPLVRLSASVRGEVSRFGAQRTIFGDFHATALLNREIARRFLLALVELKLVEDRAAWRSLPPLEELVDRLIVEYVEARGARIALKIQGDDRARFEVVPVTGAGDSAPGAPLASGTLNERGWALVEIDPSAAETAQPGSTSLRLRAETRGAGADAPTKRSEVIEVDAPTAIAGGETAASRP